MSSYTGSSHNRLSLKAKKVKSLLVSVTEFIFPGISIEIKNVQNGDYLMPSDQENLSNVALQMVLYYNVLYFFQWFTALVMTLTLKFNLLETLFQKIYVTGFIACVAVEIIRLFFGYIGNLKQQVAEIAAFWLLTVVQFFFMALFLFYGKLVPMSLDFVCNLLLMGFVLAEVVLGYAALKRISTFQETLFHVQQLKGIK